MSLKLLLVETQSRMKPIACYQSKKKLDLVKLYGCSLYKLTCDKSPPDPAPSEATIVQPPFFNFRWKL